MFLDYGMYMYDQDWGENSSVLIREDEKRDDHAGLGRSHGQLWP